MCVRVCECLGGGALWTCLLFLTESKWRVCARWQGLFHQTHTNCGRTPQRDVPSMQNVSWTVSVLIWLTPGKRLWYGFYGKSLDASWHEKKIQHCILFYFFFPPELLKAGEPFSASTWLVFSFWYKSLEFWKGTVVHTNSLLLLSIVDKSV